MDTGEWMRQQEIDLWREIVESFENGEITQMNEYTVLPTSGEWLTYAEAHFIEEDEQDEEAGLEVCSEWNARFHADDCTCPACLPY